MNTVKNNNLIKLVTIISGLAISASILISDTTSASEPAPAPKPVMQPKPVMAVDGGNLDHVGLRAHNQIRAQVGQKPLRTSKDLVNVSQTWANQLARSCKMYHHKAADFPAGENIARHSQPSSIATTIRAWAAEKKNYNYKQNTCPKGKQCYHYTQIVWKGTQEVGCAVQRCVNNSGSEIHVCTYFPRGNIVGARPYPLKGAAPVVAAEPAPAPKPVMMKPQPKPVMQPKPVVREKTSISDKELLDNAMKKLNQKRAPRQVKPTVDVR